MINLVGLEAINELHQVHRIGQVAIVKKQFYPVHVWILVKMIDPRSIEGAGPADDPVHFIPLRQL
jgi:hypothetical protein